jgi:hypothetical protein
MAGLREVDPELQRAMDGSLKAYSAGDRSFFDYLTDDVRVYSVNSVAPTTSRREFEEQFGEAFERRREVTVVSQDVDARDDRAVLSQTLEVVSEQVTSFVRQTVIWDRGQQRWRMSHIHNAQVGQPIFVGEPPRDPIGIRVLNERIATVAAAVGVAQ